jgi:hypothetical protein
MAKHKLFKIDPDSEVKGSGDGHVYVTTTPNHPNSAAGKKMPDHKKTYVPKAVAVMELSLDRYLDGEEVHHIDEDPSNNALSNLELTTHDEHAKDHSKKKKFWKKSPKNKPGRKSALRVVAAFLAINNND